MTGTSPPQTILIVEDEMDMRFFLTALLKSGGYASVSARNGKEGILKAKTVKPAAVILDVMMPEQGGALMYRELRSDPALAGTPVVMVSGVSQQTFLHYLNMLNAQTAETIPPPQAYVEKPPEPKTLLAILQKVLDGHGARNKRK